MLTGVGAVLLALSQPVLGGIITIAGPVFLYWGSVVGGRADSELVRSKLEEFSAKLDEAKGQTTSPSPLDEASAERVREVGDEFSTWAEEFIKSRHLRKLEFAKSRLDRQTMAAQVTARWSPFIDKIFTLLRKHLSAYGEKSGKEVKIELPALPADFFSSQYQGTITFGSDAVWKVEIHCSSPARKTSDTDLRIGMGTREKNNQGVITVGFEGGFNEFRIHAYGDVPVDVGIASTPLAEFDSVIPNKIRELVEAQLLTE